MSTLEPTTLLKEDAEFIASTVLEVLDQKEAYKFVKNKLLQDRHISRFTKQEISINVQNVSLSTDDNNTSTSTQGSSFHSAPSSQSTSPVNLNIVSGEVQFSPVKKVTPEKTSPPKLLSLRYQRRQLKDRFARYDQAATVTIQQLINPPVPPPAATPAAPRVLPRKPCSVCDNSRFFLFSPETRKKLTCSCDNRIGNNLGSIVPQREQPEVSQHPSQPQQQEKEVTPPPTRRQTRQRGVPKGIWDKTSHMFKTFK